MVNQVIEGIDGSTIAVHLCRRSGARVRGEKQHEGGYDQILAQLNKLKADHLTMEFTAPGAGDMAVFKQLRKDFQIVLGCVSCHPGQIDSVDTIIARVEKALEFVEPVRLIPKPRLRLRPRLGRQGQH